MERWNFNRLSVSALGAEAMDSRATQKFGFPCPDTLKRRPNLPVGEVIGPLSQNLIPAKPDRAIGADSLPLIYIKYAFAMMAFNRNREFSRTFIRCSS